MCTSGLPTSIAISSPVSFLTDLDLATTLHFLHVDEVIQPATQSIESEMQLAIMRT
jgi:hypothetical protein